MQALIIFAGYVSPAFSVELVRREIREVPSQGKLVKLHDESRVNSQADATSLSTDWDTELDSFVQQRMSQLNKSTITDHDLDTVYTAKTSEKSRLRGDRIRVAIFNNKVYGKFQNDVFHYRHHAFFEGLLDLANRSTLPNVEFVAHMADRPPCEEDEAINGLPVMTWSTRPHCNDIPIPCWTMMGRMYRKTKYASKNPSENRWQYDMLLEEKKTNPFEKRAAKLAWDLGTGYEREHYRDMLGNVDVIDLPHDSGEYEKYQFSAHMEGATYSARLKNILLKGSIPVFLNPKKEQYSEYWYHWIQPNIHYLQFQISKPDSHSVHHPPVKENVQHYLDGLLNRDPAEKAQMALLGSSIAQELLRPARVFSYMEKLLRAYAARQEFIVNAERLRKLEYMQITSQKMASLVGERLTSFYTKISASEAIKLEGMKYMTEHAYHAVLPSVL